jgi:hypothetical protein
MIVSSTLSFAEACDEGIDRFFGTIAPTSKEIKVVGHYTKKSRETGEYKACELTIKKEDGSLTPRWDNSKLDQNNGDGGALWPFSTFPTIEPKSDDYRIVTYFNCSASEDGFTTAFSYRHKSNVFVNKKSGLSISKNSSGTYDVLLTTGKRESVVCRGELSEK